MTNVYRGSTHLFDNNGEDVYIKAGPGETLQVESATGDIILNYGTESTIAATIPTEFFSIYPVHFDAIPYTRIDSLTVSNVGTSILRATNVNFTTLSGNFNIETAATTVNLNSTTLICTNSSITSASVVNVTITTLTTTNVAQVTISNTINATSVNVTSTASVTKRIIPSNQDFIYGVGDTTTQSITSVTPLTKFTVSQTGGSRVSRDTNFAFTVSTTGFYLLCCCIEATAAASQFSYGFSKNSLTAFNLSKENAISACKTSNVCIAYLTASDVVRFLVEPSAGSLSLTFGSGSTNIFIMKFY